MSLEEVLAGVYNPSFPSQELQEPVMQAGNVMKLHPSVGGWSPLPEQETPANRLNGGQLILIPLCRKGDRTSIERHLQAGTASVDEVDVEGNTPLHVAAEAPRNEIAVVQCLLENGANVNAPNYIGAVPLHYVCLRKANYRGVANILLENGAHIDRQTLAGRSPLHFACEHRLPEFVEVLCLFAADANLPDYEGNLPAHMALTVREGGRDTVSRQILEHLASYQAEFSSYNLQGLTPLHVACQAGFVRCAHFLLERGADVQVLTARADSCLHLACRGSYHEVAQLVIQVSPVAINLADELGDTPLHVCAQVGDLECATLLLRASADTNLKNLQKRTAFDISQIRGTDLNSVHNPELVQVLKEAKQSGNCRQS